MTTTAFEIHGQCDERFSALREAFADNFASGTEVGAAVTVTVDGRPVVDLWGGHMDRARTRPWLRDTIVTVYSTTKGMTALCAHRLVEQGLLDLDAPVARYWPEFAQAGKQDVPVHMLLSHRVGLPGVSDPLPADAIYEWETMTAALAAQEPLWEPGTGQSYHALTFGWLVGEVVRRVSGKSLGTFFRDEVAEPLGLDFHIGTGPEHDHRIAEMIAAALPTDPDEQARQREELRRLMDPKVAEASGNIPMRPNAHNSEQWKRAEIPAANGHGDARSLARVYGALARGGELDGVHVLGREQIARATVEQRASGPSAAEPPLLRFGLGFMLSGPEGLMGPNTRSFGHMGWGGSVGFADPDANIGFGYVMNQMQGGVTLGTTGARLISAVYASL